MASIIAGADGILGKAALGQELCDALRTLARGDRLPLALNRAALDAVVRALPAHDLPVLGMLLHDVPLAEIATTLKVSEQSLHAQRYAILKTILRTPLTVAPDHPSGITMPAAS